MDADVVGAAAVAVVAPLPKVATQSASVPRAMPKSLAMPDSVALFR